MKCEKIVTTVCYDFIELKRLKLLVLSDRYFSILLPYDKETWKFSHLRIWILLVFCLKNYSSKLLTEWWIHVQKQSRKMTSWSDVSWGKQCCFVVSSKVSDCGFYIATNTVNSQLWGYLPELKSTCVIKVKSTLFIWPHHHQQINYSLLFFFFVTILPGSKYWEF